MANEPDELEIDEVFDDPEAFIAYDIDLAPEFRIS